MDKSKQLLILTIGKYPHIGGKSTHIETLNKTLPRFNLIPKIISFSSISPVKRGISVLPRLFTNISLDFAIRRHFLQSQINKLSLKDFPIMLVQDTPSYPLSQIKHNKRPFILTLHGSAADEYASKKEIQPHDKVYKQLLNEEIEAAQKAFAVITVDTNLKNQLEARSKIDEKKVIVLPNTVDTAEFYPPLNKDAAKRAFGFCETSNIAVVIRRLVPKNGVEYAIRALGLLERDDIKLVIAGDGQEMAFLKKLVLELSLKNKVVFLGPIPHSKTKKLLQAADIALLPSIPDRNVIEATSISALEAMASSLPIIASSIGGLKELISPDVGLLVPPKSPEAIKEAWEILLNNPDYAKELGIKARARVLEKYSLENWSKTYVELIYEAINQSNRLLGC